MNKSTAAFLGLSSTPVGSTGTTMFVIRNVQQNELVKVSEPGHFGWFGNTLQTATRFPTADEAWAAIALRNKTQAHDRHRPFVIVPVKVIETPGAELTETVPSKRGVVIRDTQAPDYAYPDKVTSYGFRYTNDIAKALFFDSAEQAGMAIDQWRTRYGYGDRRVFSIEPYTQPASTTVVGREPSTTVVELA